MSTMQFKFENENEKKKEEQKQRERKEQQELERRRQWEMQERERIRTEIEKKEKDKQKELENTSLFKKASEEISKVMNQVDDLLIEIDLKSDPPYRIYACKEALLRSSKLLNKIQIEDLIKKYGEVLKIANDEANKDSQNSHGAIELISKDLSHFKEFLKVEADLLLKSGLKSRTVNKLINQIEENIDQFINNPITVDDLLRSIKEFKWFLVHQNEQLIEDLDSNNLKNNIFYSLGGLAIIAVNISAAGILTPVGAGASAGLGANLVTDAIKTLVKKQ